MRYLLALTLGFAGAVGCALYLPPQVSFGLGLFLLPCFLGCFWGKLRKWALILGGIGLGLLWFWGFHSLVLRPVENAAGQTRPLSVTVSTLPQSTAYGWSVDGRGEVEGRTYTLRLYGEGPAPRPGDILRGDFRLESTLGDRGRYHRGMGIFLLGFQEGELLTVTGEEHLRTLPVTLRSQILVRLGRLLPEDVSGFGKALLLGDTGGLSPDTDWDFSISGIRHVVAVSGLHVAMLFWLLSLLTGRKHWLTCLLGFPALLLFCAVTGFTPSVSRAAIMLGLMMLAQLLNRDYDPLTELSLAVLVLLMQNPLVITSVSFQLSAASVLGILLFYGPLYEFGIRPFRKKKGFFLAKWVVGSFAVSLSALVTVTPLMAFHFGSVSLISPITNLLTIWVIPVIFWGLFGVLALSLVSVGGALLLGRLVALPMRYVLGVAEVLGKFPLAAVYTESLWVLLWLIGAYALGFWLLGRRQKQPGLFAALTALGLAICLTLSWVQPGRNRTEITVLDVGQGQCILLQAGGRSFLVDCGGQTDRLAADAAASALLGRGIPRLDGLILSHYDRDHVGGAEALLHRVSVDTIYVPGGIALPEDSRLQVVRHRADLTFGDCTLTIFGGGDSAVSNEMSLCVLLESENYGILITGDRSESGEEALLSEFFIPKVNCLVAGHHGAGNSTSEALLRAARPETVVISAGSHNPYGHPAPETLLRLRKFGCEILRTDQQGTIRIRR